MIEHHNQKPPMGESWYWFVVTERWVYQAAEVWQQANQEAEGSHLQQKAESTHRKWSKPTDSQSPCPVMYFLQQGSSLETTSNTATNQRPGAPIPEPLGDNSHWEHHTSQIPEIYEFEGYVSNTWTFGEHKKTSELCDATLHWSLLQTLYISFSYHWCSQYCRLQMACVEAPKSRAAANSFLVSFAQTWGTPVTLGIQVDTVRNVLWNQLLLNIREAHPALQFFRHC